MTSATYRVTGMTCEHCMHAVTEELKNIGGVTGSGLPRLPSSTS